MSGGSYQYAYSRLENDFLYEFAGRANTPQRRAFLKHLEKVAKAMHDIEWVDSGDYGPGDENAAIMECIGKFDLLQSEIEDAKKVVESLNAIITEHGKEEP